MRDTGHSILVRDRSAGDRNRLAISSRQPGKQDVYWLFCAGSALTGECGTPGAAQ